jgi:ankyrin repeat protein
MRTLKLVVTFTSHPKPFQVWDELGKPSLSKSMNIVQEEGFKKSIGAFYQSRFGGQKTEGSVLYHAKTAVFVPEIGLSPLKPVDSFEFLILLDKYQSKYEKLRTRDHVTEFIEKCPSLFAMYEMILSKVFQSTAEEDIRTVSSQVLQILCSTFEPLRPKDFYRALNNPECLSFKGEYPGRPDFESFLREHFCGLVNLNNGKVYLCSMSLRAFLETKPTQLAPYGPIPLHYSMPLVERQSVDPSSSVQFSHLHLARLCLDCIQENRKEYAQETTKDVPFLDYSKRFWKDHKDLAGPLGSQLDSLIEALFQHESDAVNEPPSSGSFTRSDSAHSFAADRLLFPSDHVEDADLQYPGTFWVQEPSEERELRLTYPPDRTETPRSSSTIPRKRRSDESSQPTEDSDTTATEISQLRSAMRKRNKSLVGQMLGNFNLERNPGSMETALKMAVEVQSLELVELVISKSNKIDFDTCIRLAAKTTYASVCDYLLAYGAEVNSRGSNGVTPLHYAAATGPLNLVRSLLKWGAQPGATDAHGSKPIHFAAKGGQSDIALFLRSIGPKEEEFDNNHRTALYVACTCDRELTAQALLKDGCGLLHRNHKGRTMLHAAANNGSSRTVQLLLDAGFPVNVRSPEGIAPSKEVTPLHLASLGGWEGIVSELLDRGASVETYDSSGETPLLYACSSRNVPEAVVALLLEKRADPKVRGLNGNSALHYACLNSNVATVTLLLEWGLSVESENGECLTPLHLACASKVDPRPKVGTLLRFGGRIDSRNGDGLTPIQYAKREGQEEQVVAMLEKDMEQHGAHKQGTALGAEHGEQSGSANTDSMDEVISE